MTFKTKLRDGQIPLPTQLRDMAGVADGDLLEVTFEQGRFIVTPESRRRKDLAAFGAGLEELRQAAERKGAKMSMRQINAEIAAYRREKREKERALKQPVSGAYNSGRGPGRVGGQRSEPALPRFLCGCYTFSTCS